MAWRLSKHAEEECERRAIPLALLEQVMKAPQQIVAEHDDLVAYQSLFVFADGGSYLLRAIVAEREPKTVVTVYRTSRIAKYWRA